MIFNYDRNAAITYAKEWCKNGGSSDYPDLTSTYGNNISFLYQCLFNGGFFWNESAYLDTFSTNLSPVIARLSAFFSALKYEVDVQFITSGSTSFFNRLKTGDIVFVRNISGGTVGLIAEVTNSSLSFYGTSPIIYGSSLPEGDLYMACLVPDLGER